MIAMLGPESLTIVLLIALVFFGAKRLPEMARSLGKAKNEFIKGQRESDQEEKPSAEVPPAEKTQSD